MVHCRSVALLPLETKMAPPENAVLFESVQRSIVRVPKFPTAPPVPLELTQSDTVHSRIVNVPPLLIAPFRESAERVSFSPINVVAPPLKRMLGPLAASIVTPPGTAE